MCKIHTINKYASINRKSVQTNVDKAKLTRSIILNPDWPKYLIPPKLWPTSSTTSKWSKVCHKDLFLTSLLKASGHFLTKKERWRNTATYSRTWPLLVERCHECVFYVIYTHNLFYYFIPSHPVLIISTFPAKIFFGQKAVLMSSLWPPNSK